MILYLIKGNLGPLYRSLVTVMNKKKNLANAVEAYEEALKIYTPCSTTSIISGY